jgi:hypothetical protein
MNVKSSNNISKWQVGFNLAFKVLKCMECIKYPICYHNLKDCSSWNEEVIEKSTDFRNTEYQSDEIEMRMSNKTCERSRISSLCSETSVLPI